MQLASMDVNSSHSQPHAGAGSQIRSRVTVVCAECKRLKLKCDRRTPCSSCLKRDTVPRCTYSAAAAEKVDVQSLHNRVLVLESQLSQLTSGKMKLSSHDMDHALLAVGSSGSSVLVPLDDVAGVWLEHLDLGRDSGVNLQPAFLGASDSETHDKRDYTRTGSSPRSHGGSVDSSPHPTRASAASPFAFPQLNYVTPPSVTPALLGHLPSAQQRPVLLDVLGSVLRMHPSLNFPHFRARVNAMFTDGSSPEEIGIGPPRTDYTEKPTLSFFAAAAAGFALSIQCSPAPVGFTNASSPHTSPSPAPSAPTVTSLLSLSASVLDLAENTMPYDLDFLHALVLRCLCMLHDGMPRVSQAVFVMVGKMVNIARLMGLARDPDEFTCGAAAKYSLWEAEMRRRMWWDVFYYDLFISDCMGFSPLILDDQHTCRMPSDVDEDAFLPKSAALPTPAEHINGSNFSYFVQKCKLAQLVKNMKKRVCHDQSSSSNPPTSMPPEPSIDIASQAESEIQQYLSDLPQAFKLDVDTDPADPAYCSTSSGLPPPSACDKPSPHLVIQRCELVAIAHQLILKLFHPFLRRPNMRPPDNAMIASINASHAIIHASRIARGVWQRNGGVGATGHLTNGIVTGATTSIPSSHGVFYPFTRQLFDATIVAAHVVIQAPQSVVAKVALDDVRVALDVLRDPAIATGRGRAPSRGGVEGCPSEAVSIVEMMLRKAEMAKRNYVPVAAGIKRKHEEVDTSVSKGFWLPYVGTGVATEPPLGGSNVPNGPTGQMVSINGHVLESPNTKYSDRPFALENPSHPQAVQHRPSTASTSVRDKDKERKYPAVGIRSRVSAGSSADRRSPGGSSRRREPSISRPPQQPCAGDAGAYGRPTSSTAGSAPSMLSESMQRTSGEFALQAPYRVEDRHVAEMNVTPTSSRFPPQSQPPPPPQPPSQSHTYSAHPYQPAGSSGPQHQPLYDSTSYGSEPSRQPPATSYYVPYQPSVPPPQSAYQPMNSHGQPHDHGHAPQEQHPHLNMIGLLPNQNAMDTADVPRITKQEEGNDRGDAQSHSTASPFAGAEGWTDGGVSARFATQTPWNPGYSY